MRLINGILEGEDLSYGLQAVCISILVLVSCITMATAGDVDISWKFTFNSTQAISGNGMANSYQYLSANSMSMKNSAHGTGSLDLEQEAKVRQRVSETIDGENVPDTKDFEIIINDSSKAVYSEYAFNTGKTFRSNPIRSLWDERTCEKNYKGGIVMDASFSRSKSVEKDLSARLYWNYYKDIDDYELRNNVSHRTYLDMDTNFDGSAHIGALMIDPDVKASVTKTLVDEDYAGLFTLRKKMSIEGYVKAHSLAHEWLPCCSGGWDNMSYLDRAGHGASAKGIFDCSCYDVPATAEFQRTY